MSNPHIDGYSIDHYSVHLQPGCFTTLPGLGTSSYYLLAAGAQPDAKADGDGIINRAEDLGTGADGAFTSSTNYPPARRRAKRRRIFMARPAPRLNTVAAAWTAAAFRRSTRARSTPAYRPPRDNVLSATSVVLPGSLKTCCGPRYGITVLTAPRLRARTPPPGVSSLRSCWGFAQTAFAQPSNRRVSPLPSMPTR